MASFQPHAEYSETADALYVALGEAEVALTRELDDRRLIDLSEDGQIVGIEFLDVSGGVDLRGVPLRDEVGKLIRDFPFRVLA